MIINHWEHDCTDCAHEKLDPWDEPCMTCIESVDAEKLAFPKWEPKDKLPTMEGINNA